MAMVGILGGMGPLATVDFMDKIVRLTMASSDQEHIPLLVANLPHIEDRSNAIINGGADPLPALLDGIDLLNQNGVGLIVIPCNSAHHWYDPMRERSKAPVLHIVQACVAAVPRTAHRVAVLATGGALVSGFYQQTLVDFDIEPVVPDKSMQLRVAACIREVKAGKLDVAGARLEEVLKTLASQDVCMALMACTEIPLAAQRIASLPLTLIDSSLELARATVKYACERGWNRPE
ncbi:aspartate racemase [Burkholderia sp. HI2714]|uniref:aspartate/glutamate racemase family protein n=1 Tax=Burkholderia sp. HI2714 TaxID=2015359 RepID=UPI000B7A15FA|nr:amino acid racemase [Burkholderia sp. HI2714]OXJ22615.1 aspartate racemase [Burkholderia sp. HI2714]